MTERQDSNAGLTENFYYDADNRLHYSTLINGSTSSTNLQLSYFPNGSIETKTEAGGTDAPIAYNVTHWTSYNYPQSIGATLPSGQTEGATFDYGPDRQRWRMVYTEGSASETTEYIGGLMEKVTSGTGVDYRYYIDGADGLAAIVSTIAGTHYVLENQEGNITSLLTSSGSIAASESYTAYGNRREASTWSGAPSSSEEAAMDAITRQGFTGQTMLGQMGLNHMNGRVEDAVSGTFLSADPYTTDPYNTQDYYRYAYVYNNPLSNVDPSGYLGFQPVPSPNSPPGEFCTDWYPNLDSPPTQSGPATIDIDSTPLPDFTTCFSFDSSDYGLPADGFGPPAWQGSPQGSPSQPPVQQTNPCPTGQASPGDRNRPELQIGSKDAVILYPAGGFEGQGSANALTVQLARGPNALLLTVANIDDGVMAMVMAATGTPVRLTVGIQGTTQLGPVQSSYSITQQIPPGNSVFTSVPGQYIGPGQVTAAVVNRGGYTTAVTLQATPTAPQTCRNPGK